MRYQDVTLRIKYDPDRADVRPEPSTWPWHTIVPEGAANAAVSGEVEVMLVSSKPPRVVYPLPENGHPISVTMGDEPTSTLDATVIQFRMIDDDAMLARVLLVDRAGTYWAGVVEFFESENSWGDPGGEMFRDYFVLQDAIVYFNSIV